MEEKLQRRENQEEYFVVSNIKNGEKRRKYESVK